MMPYAELRCRTNFSFLHGASHPEELVERAQALGYAALAITDECSLAGVVRAHLQARGKTMPVIIGSQFRLPDELGPGMLVLLARNRQGYGDLSELITRCRARAPKGSYVFTAADLSPDVQGCIALLCPEPGIGIQQIKHQLHWLRDRFQGPHWLAAQLLQRGHDQSWLEALRQLSRSQAVRLVATGDVLYHLRSRRALADVLTAIRMNTTVGELGAALTPNAEQHLRSRLRLAQLYPASLLEETLEVAAQCSFSLDELRYEYPEEIVPPGHTPSSWLRHLTYQGAPQRYPGGLPQSVSKQLEHELSLIAELRYEAYFLTVADIVSFARSQGILCQGRGSAANSAVCYCLGITEVDPARMSVLFERFISRERNEPPDIDVDFEHQRREEVMQYIYGKYGRDRAALTATVVSYRPRSAMRDIGKALGVDTQQLDELARNHAWWDGKVMRPERLAQRGFDVDSPVVQHWVQMTNTLMGFPRHLSQHTGGFVIARDKLTRLVPIENAAMADRSVIQWDKDDLDALGLLKVDILALGMLSAIRRALDLIGQRLGQPFAMQDVPAEDPQTYEMISRADTVGVFQIESRAQMSMLPRLRPREFYDLVIEVAIVRPGPIQGGMVHPYLRRRQGLEQVDYPREEIKPALARTLGVPIFQEQVMQIAILAAGFTPGEADQLRRAMAAWKRKGGLGKFYARLVDGMLERGYERSFAERIFKQIQGFGEYGFPESHAASFALLVYVSCWIKCHEPAAFLAAMLNSQPMGFYAPAQLVRDAREHGVEVRAVDVLISDDECTLEEFAPSGPRPQPAVRLGLNQVQGLSRMGRMRLLEARALRIAQQPEAVFVSVEDLAQAAQLERDDMRALAQANALEALAGHRANAHWEVAGIERLPGVLRDAGFDELPVLLPAPSEGQNIVADYAGLGIPMGRHPVALLRKHLARFGVLPAKQLREFPDGRLARASGVVTHRQRPETAKGTIFVTLEDETGAINVIIWPALVESYRREVLSARLMTVYGVWQRDQHTGGQVMNLVARRIVDHSALLGQLGTRSRDFH